MSDPFDKKYWLPASAVVPLVEGLGAGIATDMIMVEGRPICFMYREEPINDVDSGWRFFSGAESRDYVDDSTHMALYDLNTIANYDRDIIPFLDSPPGSAFGREPGGQFEPEDPPEDPDE